jgi:hypothetical protein
VSRKFWTSDENDFLRENYSWGEKPFLCERLKGRTWEAIKIQTSKLGLSRQNMPQKMWDGRVLLEEIPASYYWIGFLLADGHFSKNYRIKFHLQEADFEQVVKFSRYINYSGELKGPYIAVRDRAIVEKLMKKFDIKNDKSYSPAKIDWVSDDNLFVSLFVGFIDGDGCISKQYGREDCLLRIKLHSSWLENLACFSTRVGYILDYKLPEPKINNKGYAQWMTGDNEFLRTLNAKVNDLSLPVLTRKWDKIDMNAISRYKVSEERRKIAREMVSQNYSNTAISKKLGVSPSSIYKMRKRYEF